MHNASINAPASKQAGTSLFLQELKVATANQHTQLEQQELLAALMSPGVTLKQYCAYLAIMQQVMWVYESIILPVVASVIQPGENNSSSVRIDTDLKYINFRFANNLPSDYLLPQQQFSLPYALGFMYVIEGSKLGGKVIYKHISRVLGFTENQGAGFLANTGADTGSQWKQFMACLAIYMAENDGAHEAIAGATEAFTSIYNHLQLNRAYYAD